MYMYMYMTCTCTCTYRIVHVHVHITCFPYHVSQGDAIEENQVALSICEASAGAVSELQLSYTQQLTACEEALSEAAAEAELYERESDIESRRLADNLYAMREDVARSTEYLDRLDGKLPTAAPPAPEPEPAAEPEPAVRAERPFKSNQSDGREASGFVKVLEGIDKVSWAWSEV